MYYETSSSTTKMEKELNIGVSSELYYEENSEGVNIRMMYEGTPASSSYISPSSQGASSVSSLHVLTGSSGSDDDNVYIIPGEKKSIYQFENDIQTRNNNSNIHIPQFDARYGSESDFSNENNDNIYINSEGKESIYQYENDVQRTRNNNLNPINIPRFSPYGSEADRCSLNVLIGEENDEKNYVSYTTPSSYQTSNEKEKKCLSVSSLMLQNDGMARTNGNSIEDRSDASFQDEYNILTKKYSNVFNHHIFSPFGQNDVSSKTECLGNNNTNSNNSIEESLCLSYSDQSSFRQDMNDLSSTQLDLFSPPSNDTFNYSKAESKESVIINKYSDEETVVVSDTVDNHFVWKRKKKIYILLLSIIFLASIVTIPVTLHIKRRQNEMNTSTIDSEEIKKYLTVPNTSSYTNATAILLSMSSMPSSVHQSSDFPSQIPSFKFNATFSPSISSSFTPSTFSQSISPSSTPSTAPPSLNPSLIPSKNPSSFPSPPPTASLKPSISTFPSPVPTLFPTSTFSPSSVPTVLPSNHPSTSEPTSIPSKRNLIPYLLFPKSP